MASAANDSDDYVPSEDHDELSDFEEDERPNRWHGPRTTWRNYNSEEIATATALKEIQDRDLSVHLYNAFSLKQRYRKIKEGVALDGPVTGKDVNATTGELVQPDEWLPQRSWTAWPMRADKVPSLQDSRMNDPDERFTLRRRVREMPSSALEEIISGEILKTARLKFNARPWAKPTVSDEDADGGSGQDEDEMSDEETVASTSASGRSGSKGRSRSRSRSKSVKHEIASGEQMDIDPKPRVELDKKPLLKPEVSTDDDLSYKLLRPTVRHILTQLDATLKVLHNVQESTLNYQSDSSNSEASDSSRRSSFSRGRMSRPRSRTPAADSKKRAPGRPPGPSSRNQSRARSQPREPTPLVTEEEGDVPAKRTGRPKKTYARLDGETDKQFAIRIARLRKKPLPVFSDDEPEPESVSDAPKQVSERQQRARSIDSGNVPSGDETAGPISPRTRRRKRKAPAPAPARASPASTTASRNSRARRRSRGFSRHRVGLRDWRDVLGAAALAGFPPAALDRAARRCADLFGQSLGLQTLVEGPAFTSLGAGARKVQGGRETVYEPGMAYPPLVDLGVDGEEEGVGVGVGAGEGGQMKIPIRTRGANRGSIGPGATSEDEAGPSSRRSGSRAPARSRSRSGSAPGSYVCSVKDCPRAADGEGFARRTNLLRHLKLVHGWTATASATPGEGGEETAEEVDSEDEMYGAVHLDGFLKPIRMRPGWRAADSGERSRSRSRKGGYRTTKGKGKSRGKGKGRGESEADDDGGDDGDGDVRMGERGYDE
ncbi:hypothetical protein F5B19DRAFT_504145 [Rostrohypoxylon terebratum]|nr:hypothetical protein F5B19DRAFT_504145 [Rostrohypoxylon terebratum]